MPPGTPYRSFPRVRQATRVVEWWCHAIRFVDMSLLLPVEEGQRYVAARAHRIG